MNEAESNAQQITPPWEVDTDFEVNEDTQLENFMINDKPFYFRPIYFDKDTIKQIFVNKEYELPINDFKPKLILDCGGNIGCSAVYFANVYPDAQIFCVEPQKDNFTLLKKNSAFYENIHPINSAIWGRETSIAVLEEGRHPTDYMTFETSAENPNAFSTVTISKLLADSGFDEIDLLKIDVEGAEKELFSAPNVHDWLSKVNILAIELHDRMKRGCSYEFFKAMSNYHWHFELCGENLIFIREKLLYGYDETSDESKKTPVRRTSKKIGRNDPCPCGSGKKYKNCCGKNK